VIYKHLASEGLPYAKAVLGGPDLAVWYRNKKVVANFYMVMKHGILQQNLSPTLGSQEKLPKGSNSQADLGRHVAVEESRPQ